MASATATAPNVSDTAVVVSTRSCRVSATRVVVTVVPTFSSLCHFIGWNSSTL